MITITAATGRYGRLVIESLLRRGVPASEIVAAVRSPEKASDLAAQGIKVREADFDRPETLVPAFVGTDKVLLIPSTSVGQRFTQMERAVNAAIQAGVGLIAYAGFVNTDTSTLRLGDEHKQTEAFIRASGVPYVMLRNGAYIEVYAGDLGGMDHALNAGVVAGSTGTGKISGAGRGDLAEAAAVVLISNNQAGKVYELGGTAFTKADIVAAVAQVTGKKVIYQDLPPQDYAKALAAGGFPLFLAEIVADTEFSATQGDWYTESTDLPTLLGRPSTPLVEVVAATLKRNKLL